MDKVLSGIKKTYFRNKLAEWFRIHRRALPWRNEGAWYAVFLSEFLLQQTQIEQALPYYNKFIERYPTLNDLAQASEYDVLTLWSGLGYYTRARNLLKSAQIIASEHGGQFPRDYQIALSLPGIGAYTAAAILSIAFNLPYAVVDGNVQRVVTRLFCLSDDVRLSKTKKHITQIVHALLDKKQPGSFNEALMELGALVCKPRAPLCNDCPLHSYCRAYQTNRVEQFPFKSPPAVKKQLKQYVLVLSASDQFLIVQRPPNGLLASMWEFPTLTVNHLRNSRAQIENLIREKYNISVSRLIKGPVCKHTYSHIHLTFVPLLVKTEVHDFNYQENYAAMRWHHLNELGKVPLHNAHKKILPWIKDFKN